MARCTIIIASKNEYRNISKKRLDAFFSLILLTRWLHIETNALVKLSVVMSEAALSVTKTNKNSGATLIYDGRAYYNNRVKERVPKIFPKKPDAIFPPILLISWLRIEINILSKSSDVISGRYLYKGAIEEHPLIVTKTRIQPQFYI